MIEPTLPLVVESPAPEPSNYFSYSQYLKQRLGAKTYKVVVSSGLSCPTRDGLLDQGGCAFCDVRGSSSYFGKIGRGKEIREQIDQRIPGIKKRFRSEKFVAYFQSYTNTYSDLDYLREIYEAALSHPEISGLAIGTRPDCLPDAVIDLLEELAQKHFVTLELGVQSFEDETLKWLERGHDGESSRDALRRLRARGPSVDTCAHLMFGSPTDTPEMAAETARTLNELGVQGVKLHQLMVLERTKLATRYRAEPFPTLSIAAYAAIVSDFIRHLDPAIYVERLTATASHPEECIAPEWSRSRWDGHNELREYLRAHSVFQGAALSPSVSV